jgi:hypothetical protein
MSTRERFIPACIAMLALADELSATAARASTAWEARCTPPDVTTRDGLVAHLGQHGWSVDPVPAASADPRSSAAAGCRHPPPRRAKVQEVQCVRTSWT